MKVSLRCLAFFSVLAGFAANLRAEDIRRQPPKDLNGYFPFQPPSSLSEWDNRRALVQRQILVAEGLWPMPTKTPLNPVIHGLIDRGEYTIEKVYFESAPGFFVTGNLYRPKKVSGKVPGVLFAHGHWKDARLAINTPQKVRQEIASGQERFESGARSIFQSLCVQLARMGCVVWQWDMLSDSDSIQFSPELVHKFATQRPEMNTTENWGLYSPQSEAHAQSIMGLQTWNAIRGLDFLLSLPEVDPERTAITGASGGGTQTMLLAAIDERIKLSYPVVMVSTAMQGGCTCENASLLRVNTGNIEFAGLFAPKPQGMNSANDWTKELSTKGFPELKALYSLYGKPDSVSLQRGEHFPHNYNAVTRSGFYSFLNKHFRLGQESPVIEQDFTPLPPEQLTVWDTQHPAPKAADPNFERTLLRWFHEDAQKQLERSASAPGGLQKVVAPAIETMIGRTLASAGSVEWLQKSKNDHGAYAEYLGTVLNKTYSEEVPIAWLQPKQWNGKIVLWLNDQGRSSLRVTNGALKPAIARLLESGAAVLGADLLFQSEGAGKSTEPMVAQNRTVQGPREFAGYTYGYNHALLAQRAHDVLTVLALLRAPASHPPSSDSKTNSKNNLPLPAPSPVKSIALAAWGAAAPAASAARALAAEALSQSAIDSGGFRFGKLLDYKHPQFLPGGAKYLDLPGMLAVAAPSRLWIAGEADAAGLLRDTYRLSGAPQNLVPFSGAGDADAREAAAVAWLAQ